MTYKEYISKALSKFQVSGDDVEIILINQSVLIPNPDAQVDVVTAKKALVTEFARLIPVANISEGGYSISWNWEAIKLWYHSLCAELGVEPVSEKRQPVVRNMSDLW
ncbi:DUF6706 family protein [Leadbetterella byssophila]|uniref:DUF6706 family protein n=1 Tax=Leadbetterella byssophila TaxID=316068 RepID=UPI0039A0AD24